MKSLLQRAKILFTVFLLVFSLSGCIYLVVGGLGALGGYVVSPDTVEGISSYDETELWDAAEEVLAIMGTISESKEAGGLIIARLNGVKVTVNITAINSKANKLTVKARKGIFPKIAVAQDVYTKIVTHLSE
ncbi:MAG: hypothetical protein A2787_01470 [Omnitrophica WOR_2 bacterium RIFCSPHIGHO2_01_FULL_48_9]|nr:MAG: hypothetical protein A3D10_04090 [Omnitrophica WOR_2 bacterium RIFCSPHIGHO2_02_FULL_48_11]OGX32427.1 MAG: hypothetical protein A2787_01470 [Omnitrophica WOR_2 bacterium RIFCSPHIGHO2_01_FULL_48_9]